MIEISPSYERIVLPNGTRVILDPIEKMRSCSIYIWIASGARYEPAESCGVSHFIEHILFKGSKKRSALDIARDADSVGAVLNAFTGNEYTCFYSRSLSKHAPFMLDILGDMIKNPRLDESDIETEKGVILEEYAMSEDSPDDLCCDEFYEHVWPDDMLGRRVLGTKETIAGMTREKLSAHIESFYTPGNTVISISGCYDREAILDKINEYFGGGDFCPYNIVPTTPEYHRHFTAIKRDFEQNQIIIAFPGIPAGDKRIAASGLMSSLLGSSTSSRLFQRLREQFGICYDIDAGNAAFLNAGIFWVNMGLLPKNEEKAINEAVKILKEFPGSVTPEELQRAKEQAVAGFIMSLESPSSRASYNGKKELLFGKIDSEETVEKRIRAVTEADIDSVYNDIFNFELCSVCAVGQTKKPAQYEKYIERAGLL